MATNLQHLNFKLSPAKYRARVSFQPNFFNSTSRKPSSSLHTDKNIYDNISVEKGFELFLQDNLKLVFDNFEIVSLPQIIFDNQNDSNKYWAIANILENNDYNKNILKIGPSRADNGYSFTPPRISTRRYDPNVQIRARYNPDKGSSINPIVYFEKPDDIRNRSLESLFLEVISMYINFTYQTPTWGYVVNAGLNLLEDYINEYGFGYNDYSVFGPKNIYAVLMPQLQKHIEIIIDYKYLATNSMYPILIKNGRVQDCNPFEEKNSANQPFKYRKKI